MLSSDYAVLPFCFPHHKTKTEKTQEKLRFSSVSLMNCDKRMDLCTLF